MKKTVTFLSIALSSFLINAQTVADFEGLTLGTDTFYENNTGASWQTNNGTFRYFWDTQFSLWDAGFAYTNKNNSTTGTYFNLYGAITGKGYNNSNNYVTASQGYSGERMIIKLAPAEKSVLGFFVTNSTYGYKTMLNGGGPARAFGDTLHTSSGMMPGNYPDWFKLTVYGYKNGTKKTDTVDFYLADYRFTDNSKDYIINTWKWLDCSRLGSVDSVSFKLTSSDVGQFGINNPTYFCLDNFSTSTSVITGVKEELSNISLSVYPNPAGSFLNIKIEEKWSDGFIKIIDISGKIVYEEFLAKEFSIIDLGLLQNGIYFLELTSGDKKTVKKIVKN